MLELQHIMKAYPSAAAGQSVPVLQIEQLTIRPHEKIALIGPSGSGKSTLLNIISGMVRPTSGSIKFQGNELTALSEKQWDKVRTLEMGYVFQNFYLLPGFSALENVLLAMKFAGIVHGKEREERAKQLLNRVGLESRLHHKSHQLSNGEQQRVAIARALANQPRLVLADEPTASLDATNAAAIVELLIECCTEQHAALILSTHDLEWVPYTDRTVRLSGGRLSNHAAENDPYVTYGE